MIRFEKTLFWSLFVFLFVALTIPRYLSWPFSGSDNAFLGELLENISYKGLPYSHVAGSSVEFILKPERTTGAGYLMAQASDYAKFPLRAEDYSRYNVFGAHTYYALYLLAPLVWVSQAPFVLAAMMVLSHLLMIFYLYRRQRGIGIPIALACLFALMIISHPAWREPFTFGEYVDRLFMGVGILLISMVMRGVRFWWIVAVVAALMSERFSLIVGCFLIFAWMFNLREFQGRTLLHYTAKRNISYLALGLILILFGYLNMKFVANTHKYSSFLSLNSFLHPVFLQSREALNKLVRFSILSFPLLCFSFYYSWRMGVLVFALMIPNIFGNIGGAEKIGFATHYHCIYFPFLVYGAYLGVSKLYLNQAKWVRGVTAASIVITIMIFSLLMSADLTRIRLNQHHFETYNFFTQTYRGLSDWMSGSTKLKYSDPEKFLLQAIPEGVRVSAINSVTPALIHKRKVYHFPMGLSEVDYVVMAETMDGAGWKLYGIENYNPPEVLDVINRQLKARLTSSDFDVDNPVRIVSPLHGRLVVFRKRTTL